MASGDGMSRMNAIDATGNEPNNAATVSGNEVHANNGTNSRGVLMHDGGIVHEPIAHMIVSVYAMPEASASNATAPAVRSPAHVPEALIVTATQALAFMMQNV